MRILVVVLGLLGVASPAFAQSAPGVVTPLGLQPFPSVTGVPSATASPPDVTMPWMGINNAQTAVGQQIRQVWTEPQLVAIQVYVRQPEGIPEEWQTQYVEIPGYWATETTQGTIYPPRWTLVNPGYGVYQWQQLPGYFQPRR